MRETTFEVFFLRSYVSIKLSGTFFEEWGMPFSKCGKRVIVSVRKDIPTRPASDDFRSAA